MYPDVIFDHLSHETVYGASRPDHEVQDCGASLFVFNRTLERFDLATDTI